MSHDHSHHHHGATDSRILRRAFFLIAGFMLVELVVGLWANALVLIADAGHMFLDAAALGLAWWAAQISSKDPDQHLSYGYHRIQVLAAFINGLTLAALVLWIGIEALERLITPQPMAALPTLGVALVGLLVNVIAFTWMHQGSDTANMRAAALHVLGDLLGSAAAVVAALCVYFFDWLYADPILSLMIAVILARGAYRVLRESTHILLEGVSAGVNLNDIRDTLRSGVPAIIAVHHLHAWALTPERPLLTLHATVAQDHQVQQTLQDIKHILNTEFDIHHTTIQVEIGDCPDDTVTACQTAACQSQETPV